MSRAGCMYQVRGIFQALAKGHLTEGEIALLKHLSESKCEYGGRAVGSYAIAVMHIRGIKEYSGNESDIVDLIEDMPEFEMN